VKPTAEELREACPGVDARLIGEHLERLDRSYFDRFTPVEIRAHVEGLSRLSPEHPVEAIVRREKDGGLACTVLAFDYPFEFSVITGVLSSMGLNILAGDIFTYEKPRAGAPAHGRAPRIERGQPIDPLRRRRIVDHFSGQLAADLTFEAWVCELASRLQDVIGLLERGDKDSVALARQRVNEHVTRHIASQRMAQPHPVLYPVEVSFVPAGGRFTRLRVVSQDTPAFLYSLSTALSLHNLSIERVRIRTVEGRIEDEIDLVDDAGRPVTDATLLGRVKFSVLLTKQFTYFLDRAPDPYAALARFEQLLDDIAGLPDRGQWLAFFSDPRNLQELARLLGASDFLWEDFIRLQYETLLPVLQPLVEGRRISTPGEELEPRLRAAMAGAAPFEERRARFNAFKDREIYLIDLDHILVPDFDFRRLAEHLTLLAEAVVRVATETVHARLAARHGMPRTVAGLAATYAVMGLGKFGGAALGYASDIELLLVYGDSGRTDGADPVENAEFFARLAMETARFIEAKRAGIFHVDLRLRPYGNAGPAACSLEGFVTYYGPGGPAHSYERLALVRLRAVGGDAALGAQLERLRDDFLYDSPGAIDLRALRALRSRQFEEKRRGSDYNAKFSPGALVDLEYAVQILQVLHARNAPGLRTPRVHRALEGLQAAGVLDPLEAERLVAAYDFLRRLINGLRMLRGSAVDLFLPPVRSLEFEHLARRMGYEKRGELEPEQQLFVEFEVRTAAVRAFVEKFFGREALPGPAMGNVADLILARQVPDDLRALILGGAGFRDPARAYRNLLGLAGENDRKEAFAKLAVLACDMLEREPDPDMALNNWERFAGALPDATAHFEQFLSQPKRLELLLAIFSRSQFLADSLIGHPEHLDWVTDARNLHRPPPREALEEELRSAAAAAASPGAWRRALRRFRRREILRIGTRDLCLRAPMRDVLRDLTVLAEAVLQIALERVAGGPELLRPPRGRGFCIMAFGKLGGEELNYSSDIDLLGLYDDGEAADAAPLYTGLMKAVGLDLSTPTEDGNAYRVDLRLRPYGRAGALAYAASDLEAYYRDVASLWEIQALLKLRPVAGDRGAGAAFLDRVREVLRQRRDPGEIRRSIRHMRETAMRMQSVRGEAAIDVKIGLGGLRDIEFLVQGLQLIHAPDRPGILTGNTLEGLSRLRAADLLPADVAGRLEEDYIFLRRVEHGLQILEDRQIHALPSDEAELTALARRMLGSQGTATEFLDRLNACLQRTHEAYETHLFRG
jgi:[glutamine synthetase] adenylyltransferase / [glutamine synthetase]-adenylyl-L-tyrosine phosphorylase